VTPPYLYEVDAPNCQDLYYIDLELYDVSGMGAAYILNADQPAILETGIGKRYHRVLTALEALDINRGDIEIISPTHVHLDHAGGAGFLARECPNAMVLTYERGVPHLADPSQLIAGTKQAVGEQWQFYVEPVPVPDDRVGSLQDGDVIDLGDHKLEVHHAPGHARHQAVYYDRQADTVFAGDAAGIYVPGMNRIEPTTPPTQFDFDRSLDDLEMLRDIAPTTLLYSHFGPRSDVTEALTEYERVLRQWIARIERKRAHLDDEAVIECFVERTDMTDVWGERKARPETRMNVCGVLGYLDRGEE